MTRLSNVERIRARKARALAAAEASKAVLGEDIIGERHASADRIHNNHERGAE